MMKILSIASSGSALSYVLTKRTLAKIQSKENGKDIYIQDISFKNMVILGIPKTFRIVTTYVALSTYVAMHPSLWWLYFLIATSFLIYYILKKTNLNCLYSQLGLIKPLIITFCAITCFLFCYMPSIFMLCSYATGSAPPPALNCENPSDRNTTSVPMRACTVETPREFFIRIYVPSLTGIHLLSLTLEEFALQKRFGQGSEIKKVVQKIFDELSKSFRALPCVKRSPSSDLSNQC